MEEEEALRKHCRRMVALVRSKQQHVKSSGEERRHEHEGAGGSECERRAGARDEVRARRARELARPACTKRARHQTSPNLTCQGPEEQLILLLRLKTFKEEMRRAAEVELHDPAVCSVCEQEQASLALRTFIRRKKTQLQFQTLKGRLNTHLSCGERARWAPFDAPHWMWEGLHVDACGSQQPGVASATAEERGVALATDEIRGYPDKTLQELI